MKLTTLCLHIFGVALLAIANAHAYPGESIVRDPATGNYIITYRSGDPDETRLMQTEFVPSTKIEPSIRSAFKVREREAGVTYRYRVSNGASAKQPIVGVWIENVLGPVLREIPFPYRATSEVAFKEYHLAIAAATPAPVGWNGGIVRDARLNRIVWSQNADIALSGGGVLPGQTIAGFNFTSMDLPGVGVADLVGMGAMFSYPDEGPGEDSAVFEEIWRLRDNDFVPRPAAIPTIAIPNPFDPTLLLDRIRAEIQTWPGKQLLDATYAAKLDGYLSSAANAFRMNQPKVAQEQIETVRKMLAKEHHHIDHDDEDDEDTEEHKRAIRLTIDRLAARVLDFDLRYVLKRTERVHEDHEQKKH